MEEDRRRKKLAGQSPVLLLTLFDWLVLLFADIKLFFRSKIIDGGDIIAKLVDTVVKLRLRLFSPALSNGLVRDVQVVVLLFVAVVVTVEKADDGHDDDNGDDARARTDGRAILLDFIPLLLLMDANGLGSRELMRWRQLIRRGAAMVMMIPDYFLLDDVSTFESNFVCVPSVMSWIFHV